MTRHVLQMQYPDLANQSETAELGMWGFIATEVLFLGGLFAAYTFYRINHETGIEQAARHTELAIGSVNTILLLTSSFIMSWASGVAREGDCRFTGRLMWAAAGFGLVFLGLKGFEYSIELREHLWPGPSFALAIDEPRVGEVFYFLYWVMTGIHALHLLVGIVAVAIIGQQALHGSYSSAYHAPIRVVTLYWHFVDLVWIFLFVIIYLPGRNL